MGHGLPCRRRIGHGRSAFICGRSMPRARHWQLDPNFRTNPSGSWHGRIVPLAAVSRCSELSYETWQWSIRGLRPGRRRTPGGPRCARGCGRRCDGRPPPAPPRTPPRTAAAGRRRRSWPQDATNIRMIKDTPPYPFMPSPTFAHSSVTCCPPFSCITTEPSST